MEKKQEEFNQENRKINILGEEWELLFSTNAEAINEDIKAENALGITVTSKRQIEILKYDEHTKKEYYADISELKRTIRHEIIHAVLFESGLETCAFCSEHESWAIKEEVVDFFAMQYPKLKKIYEELGAND